MMEEETNLIADLHIHSRFSRACSKDLNISNLVKWARIKGIGLLGTGDFTHNEWLKEIEELKEENGVYYYEDSEGRFPFILSSEISLVYTAEEKGRRVHLVYLAPNLKAVEGINEYLDSKGRRDYDGRPIFKISCRDFVAKMEEIDDRIEVIPAHIWTPWFGVFGSKGGFDSLKDAFEDKTDRIHAIETGISSDPKMNLKIKDLENISILSFSDSHSFWPWRLGREVTIFNPINSYDDLIKQIRDNSFVGTVETDPAYGKYHWDGHANCNFSCSPEKTKELNGICPQCGKPLIIGVDNRVEELADRDDKKESKLFYSLLPLHEIISLKMGKGMNTKTVWEVYNKLVEGRTEFDVLLGVSKDDLLKVVDEDLADLILKNREGKISVRPGYDGEYGVAVIGEKQENDVSLSGGQKTLF